MKRLSVTRRLGPAIFVLAAAAALPLAAYADDTAKLPTVPGSGKASSSQAPASLPGAPGLSPLEPYLVTWLLPVGGLVTVGFAVWCDKRMRRGAYRKA